MRVKKWLLCGMLAGLGIALAAPGSAMAQDDVAARGAYVATAADCAACHTAPGGKAFAGGYPLGTPLGTIISSNITPSKLHGIGNYSEQDFARAIREGVAPGGKHLYPAMPYPDYSRITDADVHALYVFFMQRVAPVDTAAPESRLSFPFNIRATMGVWDLLFLNHQRFEATPGASAEVTRGDYLVNALEHCGTCHTPRNIMMAQKQDALLAGSAIGAWYAPNITPDHNAGIGDWSDDEIAQYLRSGVVHDKAQAAGPMAEAIDHSLQHLSDPDIGAIVAYLKQVKAQADGLKQPRSSFAGQKVAEADLRASAQGKADPGWRIYSGSCAACHQADGRGNAEYPALTHNSATGALHPDNLIATILYGVESQAGDTTRFMPAFGPYALWTNQLNDRQIADVGNYVLKTFGNPAARITPADVAQARRGGARPVFVQPRFIGGVIGAIVVLAALGVVFLARWRSRRNGSLSSQHS